MTEYHEGVATWVTRNLCFFLKWQEQEQPFTWQFCDGRSLCAIFGQETEQALWGENKLKTVMFSAQTINIKEPPAPPPLNSCCRSPTLPSDWLEHFVMVWGAGRFTTVYQCFCKLLKRVGVLQWPKLFTVLPGDELLTCLPVRAQNAGAQNCWHKI